MAIEDYMQELRNEFHMLTGKFASGEWEMNELLEKIKKIKKEMEKPPEEGQYVIIVEVDENGEVK